MEEPTHLPGGRGQRPRFKLARILAPLVIALVVLSILADRVPELSDARDRLLHPAEYAPRKACQAAALAAAERPAYARIRAPGTVHATQGASYVEGVTVGEMGPAGAEVTFEFSCYVGPDGRVVNTHKPPAPRPAGS